VVTAEPVKPAEPAIETVKPIAKKGRPAKKTVTEPAPQVTEPVVKLVAKKGRSAKKVEPSTVKTKVQKQGTKKEPVVVVESTGVSHSTGSGKTCSAISIAETVVEPVKVPKRGTKKGVVEPTVVVEPPVVVEPVKVPKQGTKKAVVVPPVVVEPVVVPPVVVPPVVVEPVVVPKSTTKKVKLVEPPTTKVAPVKPGRGKKKALEKNGFEEISDSGNQSTDLDTEVIETSVKQVDQIFVKSTKKK
jgi:hypothetical protein